MAETPHHSSLELAERLGARARVCDVVTSTVLTPSLCEVVLAGGAADLGGQPGNDVMLRLRDETGPFVRRRYSVRSVQPDLDQLTLWITTAHDGPGSRWARAAAPGDPVDVIGPRGKILLDPDAAWHLFCGDVSGLGAFYRMADALEPGGLATVVVEVPDAQDALSPPLAGGAGVRAIFVERGERRGDDAEGLLRALGTFTTPPDEGHAYLFGEFSVIRVLRAALVERGLADDQISPKAYWRTGRPNAEHGEPDKSER